MQAPLLPLPSLGPAPQGGEAQFVQAEGAQIRLGLWRAERARATLFLLPGRTEYIEKYLDVIAPLQASGRNVLVVDWRGQGLSQRRLNDPLKGDVAAFGDYQHDLRAMIAFAEAQNLPRPWGMLSHSMGGQIGLRGLIEMPELFQAAVFCAPMWGVHLPVPAPKLVTLGLHLAAKLAPSAYAPLTGPTPYILGAEFEGNLLTRNPATWALLAGQITTEPRLQLAGPTLRWLSTALQDCAALAKAPSPQLPVLTAMGEDERVVRQDAIRARMARWQTESQAEARFVTYPKAEHELLMDLPETAQALIDEITTFLARHGA